MTIAAMKQARKVIQIYAPVIGAKDADDALAMLDAAISEQEKCEPVAIVGELCDQSRADAIRRGYSVGQYMFTHFAPVPAWQPIETASKDGTVFRAYATSLVDLDFNPQGSVECGWDGEKFIGCVWNGQQDCWYGKEIAPTHWMPLPAAPKPGEMK